MATLSMDASSTPALQADTGSENFSFETLTYGWHDFTGKILTDLLKEYKTNSACPEKLHYRTFGSHSVKSQPRACVTSG